VPAGWDNREAPAVPADLALVWARHRQVAPAALVAPAVTLEAVVVAPAESRQESSASPVRAAPSRATPLQVVRVVRVALEVLAVTVSQVNPAPMDRLQPR
jgi:hypothetical protein